jgi:mannitol-1-phosphate/altronate dehydrogenase
MHYAIWSMNFEIREEVQQNLQPIQDLDFDKEVECILCRFSNTKNPDTLLRICSDAPEKISTFLLSSVRNQLKKSNDNKTKFLALGIAGWFKYLRDCPVSSYNAGKPVVEELHKLAKETGRDATENLDHAGMVS